jgi:GNAT superfamily N-acetyltransferase
MLSAQSFANAGIPTSAMIELFVEHAGGRFHEAIVDLRYRLLRQPLGMVMDTRRDGDCLYIVACEADRVIGVVALDLVTRRLRQMAVDSHLQGRGIGRLLVERLELQARSLGYDRVELHARETARGFYERLGYAPVGEPFTEVGLPHIRMTKPMPGQAPS